MKIVAVLLLLAGLALAGLGAYEYSDSYLSNREMARAHLAKVERARATAGQAAPSSPEAAQAVADAEKYVRYAGEANAAADSAMTRVMLYGLGGLASIVAGLLLLMRSSSRRRSVSLGHAT